MAYPYSKAETLADAAVHAAGLLLAVPGTFFLLNQTTELSPEAWGATALYGGCLTLAFAASAIYHMCPLDNLRPVLHRIDHAAIYLKIAGSYTPFAVPLGTPLAYSVLAMVWALAIGGAIAKLSFWRTDAKGSLALYLGMGWLSALLIWPISQAFSQTVVWLVVSGGLIYSLGTRVYAHPGMPFQNAIWHSIVLTASTCLFAAVALTV
jgi:hemolysin III